jgi:phosphatidylserine/phosphatidylglycerophosphate/cardiolipin synthase-like enzyme
VNLKLNKRQQQYLEAYGKLWGYDAEWAAGQFIIEGIIRSIDRDMLDKTDKPLCNARHITKSNGDLRPSRLIRHSPMLRQFLIAAILILPQPSFGIPVEVAFSPNRGGTELVVKTIGEAQSTVRVAAYSFTSKPIAQALLDAHNRGVDVRVVVDKSQATERYSSATLLANVGIPTRVDYRYAIMHDKFIVVDGQTVEEGSFNYTASAEKKNAENVVVLHDASVAATYGQEWDRLWVESEPIEGRH